MVLVAAAIRALLGGAPWVVLVDMTPSTMLAVNPDADT
jgi:hypothetical protein